MYILMYTSLSFSSSLGIPKKPTSIPLEYVYEQRASVYILI